MKDIIKNNNNKINTRKIINSPLGIPEGSDGARKTASSEEEYPAEPKELPEWRNSWGTAGGATFLAVAAGLGGRDMPPTAKKRQLITRTLNFHMATSLMHETVISHPH